MNEKRLRFVDRLSEAHLGDLHALYRNAWWTRDRDAETVRKIVAGSNHVFGFIDPSTEELVAFARVLSDGVVKAFVFDVIVSPALRGQALGRALMERILEHPSLSKVKHFELYCLPELVPYYRRFGFTDEVNGLLLMRLEK